MSIANQIQRIKTNITNAYNEIEKFNVNVSEYNNKSDKLAEAISNITVGETINNQNKTITENGIYSADEGYTGLGEVVVDVANTIPSTVATDDVCRKNLCYWMDAIDNKGIIDIDGTRNTIAGNWWSKSGFCYFAATKTGTWNEDSITFNSTYHGYYETTPMMYNATSSIKEATYEITFNINSYADLNSISYIIGNMDNSRLYIGSTVNIATSLKLTDGTAKLIYDSVNQKLPLNQKVYVCVRMKQGVISLYSTQGGTVNSVEFAEVLSGLFTAPITVGYSGTSAGAYDALQANINLNSFRIYNRYITDDEMLANCKYEVNRFNIPEYRILTINSNVEGATVTLTADGYTQADNHIKVLKGTEVAYSVFADGYTTQTGTITVNDTQTINIELQSQTIEGGLPIM